MEKMNFFMRIGLLIVFFAAFWACNDEDDPTAFQDYANEPSIVKFNEEAGSYAIITQYGELLVPFGLDNIGLNQYVRSSFRLTLNDKQWELSKFSYVVISGDTVAITDEDYNKDSYVEPIYSVSPVNYFNETLFLGITRQVVPGQNYEYEILYDLNASDIQDGKYTLVIRAKKADPVVTTGSPVLLYEHCAFNIAPVLNMFTGVNDLTLYVKFYSGTDDSGAPEYEYMSSKFIKIYF